ncbi:MAG: peptidylprolyl isomerase [Candidatus Gastranaerophilales bacterium]|nr:peptidylprolyl isomerase [Candidatus Gastranaerophilales bacterium]
MNSKKLLATVAISAMLLTGCTFGPKNTIIKVNGQDITQTQFEKTFDKAIGNSMFAQMGMDVKKDKNGFLYLMIKDRVVNELIVKALIEQEMVKRRIKVTKEDTDKELKIIIDKVGSKEKFNEILKQNGISSEQFKKDLNDEVKIKKLLSVLSTGKVSDADTKKFYKENLTKFKYPDKVRASHILISANSEEIKEKITSDPVNKGLSKEEIQAKVDKELSVKLEKAKKILAEVKKNPKTFEKIARENSDDAASAKQGGDLGFFSRQEMVEPFAKAAFAQKPETISDIVKSPYGYHIILVKDRMKAGQEPFEKVKDEIKTYLENQANVKVLENLIESLKKQAKIEYLDDEYNPAKIQDALKKQAKSNPTAKEELHPEAQSATPAPPKPAK